MQDTPVLPASVSEATRKEENINKNSTDNCGNYSNSKSDSNSDNSSYGNSNCNKLDKLHLIADKRSSSIGLSHYIAVFLWLGWIGSYFLLLGLIILMYYYSLKACLTFLCFIVLITFIPVDRDTQPKWGFEIGLLL